MGGGRVHGSFLAGEVGELAGVSGTTIGQWARWGYIRASRSSGEPHQYAVEDIGEAAVVAELLERGVSHRTVRRAIAHLEAYGDWPLSQAPLALAAGGRLVLDERDGASMLTPRGWQRLVTVPPLEPVRLRLRHGGR